MTSENDTNGMPLRAGSRAAKLGRRVRWCLSGLVMAGSLGAFAASGTGSVFDDCVYWFCGGYDSDGNGLLKSGELTDTMHANDAAHNAHKCAVYGYNTVSGQEARGVQLREEDVYCPAQGVTNRTMCIFLPQEHEYVAKGDGSITTNACNNGIVFNTQLLSLVRTNEYTCIMRIRREKRIGNEWFFNCYEGNTLGNKGYLLGFTADGAFMSYGPQSSLAVNSPASLPTNCWADIAIVVSNHTVRLGIWRDPQADSASRGSAVRYAFASKNTTVKSGVDLNLTMHKFWIGAQNLFKGQRAFATNDGKRFCGSVQQVAFWSRALTDDEVLEAWRTPMTDVWRLGLANDSAVELGGAAAATATVDIDAITADGRWADVPGAIPAGGTLNLDFTFRKSRFGADATAANAVALPQLLCVKPLSTASEGLAHVTVNGTAAGTIRLRPNATNTLFLAAKLFTATGVNRIALTRTDTGTAAIGLDQIKLTGSFQAGVRNNDAKDFSFTPGKCPETGWAQQCDWFELRNAMNSASTSNTTNHWLHVSVPDEAVEYGCTYTVRMSQTNGNAANTNVVRLCVNGVEKVAYTNDAGLGLRQLPPGYANYVIPFEPGELKAGDNVFWWNQSAANTAVLPPCTYLDFHRFEVVDKPKGTYLILR